MSEVSIEHPGAAAHDEAGGHGSTDRTYVMVAVFLAVMTALEVATSYLETDFGVAFVWVLIALMIIKFFTVAFYFMHLKYDPVMCRRVFFFGLGVAVFIFCGMLSVLHYWAPGFR